MLYGGPSMGQGVTGDSPSPPRATLPHAPVSPVSLALGSQQTAQAPYPGSLLTAAPSLRLQAPPPAHQLLSQSQGPPAPPAGARFSASTGSSLSLERAPHPPGQR